MVRTLLSANSQYFKPFISRGIGLESIRLNMILNHGVLYLEVKELKILNQKGKEALNEAIFELRTQNLSVRLIKKK